MKIPTVSWSLAKRRLKSIDWPMKDRHKRAISGNTHFRINVFIALCNQRDSIVLLFGSQTKSLKSSIEIVAGFVNGIDNAKALDNRKAIPSEVLSNSLAAAHIQCSGVVDTPSDCVGLGS